MSEYDGHYQRAEARKQAEAAEAEGSEQAEEDTSAKPFPPNKIMIGGNKRKGWGLRGLWGSGRKAKIVSASGHPHTRENERRMRQNERRAAKVKE